MRLIVNFIQKLKVINKMNFKRFCKQCFNFIYAKVIYKHFICNISNEIYEEDQKLIKNLYELLTEYHKWSGNYQSTDPLIKRTTEEVKFSKDYFNLYLLLRYIYYIYNNILDETAQHTLLQIEHNMYIDDRCINADTKRLYEIFSDKFKELNS